MFGLERMRALAAVAAHGSVAGAARELHITPSGVSQQLNRLERETKHQLIEPDGRGIRLTHAGRVLAAHANTLLEHAATAETDLRDMDEDVIGPIRIGAVSSAVRVLLTGALTVLVRDHPRVRPTVRDGEVDAMMPELVNGGLDVVLVDSWDVRPLLLPEGVSTRILISESVDIALSTQHPLATAQELDLSELGEVAWANCPAGTDPYKALVQLMRTQRIEPDIRYTVADYATQLSLVRANLAVALIPAVAQREAPDGVRFVRCSTPLRRTITAAWRTATAGPLIRTFLAALDDAGTQLP